MKLSIYLSALATCVILPTALVSRKWCGSFCCCLLLLDDAAFSILLESRFSRFDGILVIVIVNAVGSRTITAIWHPFIVEFTAGLLSFGGSFNIIGEFRNLSLRCCYCLRTYWGDSGSTPPLHPSAMEASWSVVVTVALSNTHFASNLVIIISREESSNPLRRRASPQAPHWNEDRRELPQNLYSTREERKN